MRENRTYSSEGGDGASRFRPLSTVRRVSSSNIDLAWHGEDVSV